MKETTVIIIGAGPSGLATAACLARLSIPYLILERDDCSVPLWRKKSYDRLHLHLPKHYCELPHLPFPKSAPKYVSKVEFLRYIDDYVARFDITPLCNTNVEWAKYDDEDTEKWHVKVKDGEEEYVGRFLVVATGETTDPFVPKVEGLNSFGGKVIHSTEYKSGKEYEGKDVLIVGSGNSGMEIALDLAIHAANTSIAVRSPVHVLSREMVHMGLLLLKYMSASMVDCLMMMMSKVVYGDLTKYGLTRPQEGPFLMKAKHGKYPIIDVGTIEKIKSGEIQVLPAVESIKGNDVVFSNGHSFAFDAIVFATGFKRSTNTWLQGDDKFLNEDGLPKARYPEHWKGEDGLYCVGLARHGLYGAAADAQNIANHIYLLTC